MATNDNSLSSGRAATISPNTSGNDRSETACANAANEGLEHPPCKLHDATPGRAQRYDGHDHFSGMDGEEGHEHGGSAASNMHALRIEGRKWVNDITLAQAWAILRATAQELDSGRDLLFMMLMPNGRQPALCLDQSLFAEQLPNPAALAARLATRQEH